MTRMYLSLQPEDPATPLTWFAVVLKIFLGPAGDSMAPMAGYNTIAPPGYDASASTVSVPHAPHTRRQAVGSLAASSKMSEAPKQHPLCEGAKGSLLRQQWRLCNTTFPWTLRTVNFCL